MIQTLDTSGNTKGVVVGASYLRNYGSKGKIQDEVCNTLTSSMGMGGDNIPLFSDLHIRKLTPKECWRLMGFTDQEFEKAEKVNSNAQLYKQAGNSIVVNVLERILENLFLKEENDFEGQINFNMLGDNI